MSSTNTNNCQTNNGTLTFDIVRGPCADGAFYSFNGYNWIWTTNTKVTVSNLTARDYYVFVTNKNNYGYPDIANLQYAKTTVGVNVPGGSGIDVYCQPDITLPFPQFSQYRLYPPTYQGVCGVTNTNIAKLVVTNPNGTSDTFDPYNNQLLYYTFNAPIDGKYTFTYTITGQVGNTTITRTCTRTIYSKKITSGVTYASPICNSSQPLTAQACSASLVIATVNVSGLDPTPRDYGVRNIYISGKFPAKFNGVMTLIAPNGSRFELTKGNEFPHFDGSKGNLNVNITSCASSGYKHVADNQPFTSNGTYRVSAPLIDANNWHIDPNGTWGLEVCASTNQTWELHCFDIEFGSFCPILRDATITGGCGTTGKGSINIFRSQIEASYCDDPDNDGIPNYGIEIGGNFYTFDPVRQSIRFEGLPGTYNVTFGRYSLNAQGVPLWSCTSGLYQIVIPDTDTEKPVIIGCSTNKVINLGSNGTASFTSQHPTQVLDNCGINSTGLNVRYLQGAKNANGQILETANFTPGSSHTVNIVGSGLVEFEYWAKDNSNNTQICKYQVTVVGNPCTNDRVRPIFTDCPISQIVTLGNDNKATVDVLDPIYSDNCGVTTQFVELFYLDGAKNEKGETYLKYDIDPGKSYSYQIVNEGFVLFKYTIGDAAGNFSYCYSYIRALKNPDPCNNDTQAPVMTNCPSDIKLTLDANGEATFAMKDPDVSDNCIISSRSLNINCFNGVLYNETSNNSYLDKLYYPDFYPGAEFTYYLKGAGNTVFQYSAIDQSGNIATCRTTITTVAPGANALFNFGDVCASQGAKTYIPVTVNNFKKIGAFSFDVFVASGTGIKFLGLENAGINNISSNILGNGNLRISWDEPGGNDIDLPENFKLFDIVIEADATFISPARIEGKDLVLLSSVNSNGSIDGANICVTFTSYPKGVIRNPENIGHENVKVDLISGFTTVANTTTSNNGGYTFTNTNLTNRVVPFKNDELRRGVDISDVARIRRHFLEITPLADNYKILAADVNRDGRINVLDVAYTNRVFLHKINEFPGNTSWRFVPEYLCTSFDPLDVNLQDYIPLNGINVDDSQLNFISVKTGDVDHSALLKPEDVVESRTLLPMQLAIPDTVVTAGKNIRIPVYISGNDPLSALSMVIRYDTLMFELTGVESSMLTNFGNGNYTDLGGTILVGWDHPQAKSVNGSGTIIPLVFNTIQTSGQSLLSFSEVNAFDEDLNKYNVGTADGSVSYTTVSTSEVLTQSYMRAMPNPFTEQVDVIIELPRLQHYNIQVYDINGRLIQTRAIKPQSTRQHLKFDDFSESGVYLIRLQSEHISEVLKVIKI
ncbi:MAG: T9SS type A sorting domain-containing protein [Chitinophagales bacterium]|nr:T9SS type A sorting domain-containing protein [Chitinophagales bacterium]